MQYFDEVGRNIVTEYKSGTNLRVTNAASSQINSRPAPCSLPGSKQKVTSENKVKHTK